MLKEGSGDELAFKNPALPIEDRIEDLLSLLTLKEKINFLVDLSEAIPRLGIKKYYHGNECLHGVVRPGRATVFPQAIAFGATWDPELIHEVATAISDEARAKHHAINEYPGKFNGLLTFWSPNVNMARDPRWGRTPETYGEDPCLTGKLGVQFVKGIQGDHPTYLKAVSTPKHYVGNNEEKNRHRLKPKIRERWLRDYYLPAFKATITKGNAVSIMGAYNAVFDIPCCHSSFLLTDILRKEWGFQGYAVTDCGAISDALPHNHNYAKTPVKAAASAINAGIDLECGGIYRHGYLEKAVNNGLVKMDRIDFAVRNVLKARFRLGMFDPLDLNPYTQIPFNVVGSQKHSNLALRCAEESIVLLKNASEGGKMLLPLNPDDYKSIAVVGPNANIAQFGDYSGVPLNTPVTPLAGLNKIIGEKKMAINYVPWIPRSASKAYHVVPSRNLRPKPKCTKKSGLVRTYFPEPNFQGQSSEYHDELIDVDYRSESPDPSISNAQKSDGDFPMSKSFSVKWSGFICPDVSGVYLIKIKSHRKHFPIKGRLSVGGRRFSRKIKIRLEKNREYPIEIEFPNAGLENKLSLVWKLPSRSTLAGKKISGFSREIKAATDSDLVICYSGLSWGDEHEGHDRKDFQLSRQQQELIRVIHEVNSKIILVLIAGSNLAINWENKHIPSILHAWYPGERGGDAIANILFGNVNPGGRLPLTFYKGVNQLPPFNEYDLDRGKTYWFLNEKPLYPFGFGLSYTTFEYSSLAVDKSDPGNLDSIIITLQVRNTGNYDGDEVVQLYTSYSEKSGNKPLLQLKEFKRLYILRGETKSVRLKLNIADLAFWNHLTQSYKVIAGNVDLLIGSSSADIRLQTSIHIG